MHELLLYANLAMCAVLTIEIWRPLDERLEWAHTVLVMQVTNYLEFIEEEEWFGNRYSTKSYSLSPLFLILTGA